MGALGWVPEVFWASTPHDLWTAVEGRRQAAGEGEHPVQPPDQAAIEAMMEQFPD